MRAVQQTLQGGRGQERQPLQNTCGLTGCRLSASAMQQSRSLQQPLPPCAPLQITTAASNPSLHVIARPEVGQCSMLCSRLPSLHLSPHHSQPSTQQHTSSAEARLKYGPKAVLAPGHRPGHPPQPPALRSSPPDPRLGRCPMLRSRATSSSSAAASAASSISRLVLCRRWMPASAARRLLLQGTSSSKSASRERLRRLEAARGLGAAGTAPHLRPFAWWLLSSWL